MCDEGGMKEPVDILRGLVLVTAGVAGAGLVTMMVVTSLDVVLRKLGHPLPGAYDLVKMAAGVTIACALPYTTAVKGHVAVEFFYRRLGRRGQVAADTGIRLLLLGLFSLFTWQLVIYGLRLRSSGEVSMTLQLPVFWVPWVMAFGCVVAVLVTVYHLFHPGRRLLEP